MAGSSLRERLQRALANPSTPLEAPLEAAVAGRRQAAIALILLEREQALEMLLIERAARNGDPWSGHMALPGGHVEAADADLWATAERETWEEVGIDLRATAQRLGRLADYEPVRAVPIAVRPFVYLIEAAPTLTLSLEVQRALWVPIAPLLAGQQRSSYVLERAGKRFDFPAWDIDGHLVWGLTYRVLDEFFRRFNAVSSAP